MKRPSDYLKGSPTNSVIHKSEAETVFQNILILLKHLGDEWQTLTWGFYKAGRELDGNFTESEKEFFDLVIDYAHPERVWLFAPDYKRIHDKGE